MQNKTRPTFANLAQFLIQVNAIPVRQHLWLTGREACLHRKCRFRQVKRRFIVGHVGSKSLIKGCENAAKVFLHARYPQQSPLLVEAVIQIVAHYVFF